MAENLGTQVSQSIPSNSLATQINSVLPATTIVGIFLAVFVLYISIHLAKRYLKKETSQDFFMSYCLPALMTIMGGAFFFYSGETAAIAVTVAVISVFVPLQYLALTRHNRSIIELFQKYTHLNRDADRLHTLALRVLDRHQEGLDGKLQNGKGTFELTFERKLAQTCTQISEETIYVRKTEFPFLWKKLITQFPEYASVCDLSIFSATTFKAGDDRARLRYQRTRGYWKDRVNDEIDDLIRMKKSPKTFRKVIVYSKLSDYDGDDPSCVTSGSCDFANCKKHCIVQEITKLWQSNVGRFEQNAKSMFSRPYKQKDFVWLVGKAEADMVFNSLSEPLDENAEKVKSVDIGLFGEEFIGEEFKVPAGTGALEVQDYLYRFRRKPELVKAVFNVFNDDLVRADGATPVT